MGPRVCVVNLGCKVNRVESDWMESAFVEAGACLVPESLADVVVINTCAVTGEAEAKTRKAVRHAAALPQRPQVVATGCVANLYPDELEALAPNVRVVASKSALAREVVADWEDGPCDGDALCERVGGVAHGAFRVRRGVKVQDGCDNRCSYCIVWRARGRSRSVPLDQVEAQVAAVLAEGACEVVLSGINLGKYRSFLSDGSSCGLGGLVERVCALGVPMVRLSSIEPPDLTSDVVRRMAHRDDQVCPHLHLPLQSGCDTVLARMNRSYDTARFAETVELVRASMPHASISTDVIVGFPGETDDEFEQTLSFCAAMRFSKVHVFRYSARPDTAAAAMPCQVPPAVSRARSARLRALADLLRSEDASRRVGSMETVLVEGIDPCGEAFGTTASYHDVRLPAGSHRLAAPGCIRVELVGLADGKLVGRQM